MPLKKCSEDKQSGWKWGDQGKCYTGPEGKRKAIRQGVAIEGPEKFSKKVKAGELEFAEKDWEYIDDALGHIGLGIGDRLAYAVDLPNSDLTTKDPRPTKDMAAADLNTPIDNGNNAFEHRPPSPQSPVFQPYIPPSDSVACNPIFVGVGVIAVVWTCASAFILNDRRLYAACVALLSYVTGGPTQPHK